MYADSETGLYYNNARYYDPRIGRDISADPMSVAEHVQLWRATLGTLNQIPLELNPYAYVANNPLRWTDPSGLGTVPCPPGTSSDPNCNLRSEYTADSLRPGAAAE
ncbi:MAG: RHS repeat-associated core domain-containing protein [Sulfuricaulis sp.]